MAVNNVLLITGVVRKADEFAPQRGVVFELSSCLPKVAWLLHPSHPHPLCGGLQRTSRASWSQPSATRQRPAVLAHLPLKTLRSPLFASACPVVR
eukprot:667274-Pleurochrysis_carterae.AAC.1